MNTLHHYLSKIVVVLAVCSLAFAMFPVNSQAQVSAMGEVRVVVPPILILYYYSQITVTLAAADLGGGAVDEGANAVTLAGWTADAAMSPTAPTAFGTTQTATIQNAWGFFGVGGPTTSLDADIATGAGEALELELGGAAAATSNVGVSNFQIQYNGGGFNTALVNLPKGLDTGNVRVGDLQFALDLSGVAETGTFSDAEGNTQYTITLAYN